MYVAKFDEHGALRWLAQAGGIKADNAYTLACDAQGDLFLAGAFAGSAKFGDASIACRAGINDLYAAKLKAK